MLEQALAAGTVGIAEHQRLEKSFAALNDQFEAANEALVALGRSAGDPNTVLTTIVESARRLCPSQAVHLYPLEDGVYRLIKSVGMSRRTVDYIAEHPMPMDRDTLNGRVGLDRTTQQITDVLADPDYGRRSSTGGLLPHHHGRTLVIDDEVVGSMAVWRNEVSLFDEREMAILTAFAGQAAMAINGVKLVQEPRRGERSSRARSMVREAPGRGGGGIQLDVERVFSTIAMHAVSLSGTDGGSILEYDEHDRSFVVRATY